MATVREPVPVFIFFQYGKPYRETIFAVNVFPYPYLISSSTGNHILSQYLPIPVVYVFQLGKPYSLLISSRSRFSFLFGTGNNIDSQYLHNPNPNLNPNPNSNPDHSRSRTRRNEKRVREDINPLYGKLFFAKLL